VRNAPQAAGLIFYLAETFATRKTAAGKLGLGLGFPKNSQIYRPTARNFCNKVELVSAFYTKAEVAVILRRSTKSVERLMKQGLLKRDPTYGRTIFKKTDVESFIGRVGK
jgi:hypothetical protein